jgi:CheY-like chemotaxis protein
VAHILIVDDDEAVSLTFARMLRSEGHRVSAVTTADLGLAQAATEPPDAIILDIRMPGMGGVEFLRRLREDQHLKRLPVGIITGDYFLKDEVLAELGQLGATIRYKPLWMADLSALAQQLLAPAAPVPAAGANPGEKRDA